VTSISATGQPLFGSPLQQLQNELSSEVSAGTISTSDQSALSAALNDIDTALKSQAQSGSSSGTRPSPSDMKAKIDSLIAFEVKNGNLTSSQASELQNVFTNAFAKGGHGGHGGPGGPGRPGGPGGPGGGGGASLAEMLLSVSSSGDSTDSTSSSGSSTTSDTSQLLTNFLKLLQQSNGASSSYGSSSTSTSVSLLFSYQS
jgi:hypothetical protein